MSVSQRTTFDHHSQEFADDPPGALRQVRAQGPVGYSENHGGYWIVTRFAEAREVLRQPELFTVERDEHGEGGLLIPSAPGAPSLLPGELDGAPHEKYRRAIGGMFSKPSVRKHLLGTLETVVAATLDRILESKEFDIVDDLAGPVVRDAVFGYVGLPVEDRIEFIEDVEGAFATHPELGTDRGRGAEHAKARFDDVWRRSSTLVAQQRKNPGQDVLGHLIRATDPALSDDEILSLSLAVIFGGLRTTTSLVTSALVTLDGDPALRKRIAADTGLLPAFVEELLRFYSPAVGVARTAREDAEVGGVRIPRGARLYVLLGSANRDERNFADPDVFDIDRSSKQHLAFGFGLHHCLGVSVARLIAEVTVRDVLRRIPDFALRPGGAVRYVRRGVTDGWSSVTATVEAA